MSNIKLKIKNIVVILFAAFCSAVSLELFLIPSDVVIGGASGISSILDILFTNNMDSSLWYLSAGVWVFAINIPVIIYCFVSLRKGFALRTLLYVAFMSAMLIVLRITNVSHLVDSVINSNNAGDKVVYVIMGGALHGVCLPLVLSVNGSTGGSDIIGLIVQKHSKTGGRYVLRSIFIANLVILALSSLAYGFVKGATAGINMFIYSVAAQFVCEIVQETIFKGFSAALELEITTDKSDAMREALISEIKHGVTTIRVVGGYSKQEKKMVVCVINRRQLVQARKIIHRVDPQAFAYVENVKEVIGKGFANKEEELDVSEHTGE